jgi:hypothetical protein
MSISARRRPVLFVLASLAVLVACSSGKAVDGDAAAGGGGGGGDGVIDGGGGSAAASWDAAGNEAAAGEGGGSAGAADSGSGFPDASDGGLMTMVIIPATANIWGAGHAMPPDPSGVGPGVLPILVELPPGTGRTMTVTNVSGSVDFDGPEGPIPENGADGLIFTSMPLPADAGPARTLSLGGIVAPSWCTRAAPCLRFGSLAAVFLASGEPEEPSPAPYNVYPRAPVIDGVAVHQIFFVGDGRDGPYADTGEVQTFRIPDDATRVFFGFMDALGPFGPLGGYNNNTGQLRATVTISR